MTTHQGGPAVVLELRDLTAAADLIAALRSTPARRPEETARRRRLANNLEAALFPALLAATTATTAPSEE